MNNLKYIFSLVMAVLWMAAASAQTFYYYCGEKIPLTVVKGRKVILSDGSKRENILPRKGDKIHTAIHAGNYLFTIYEESDPTSPLTTEFKAIKSKCSVYDCYYTNGQKVAPTGEIYVQLKNLADTVILKSICEKFDCVIVGPNSCYPKFYKLRIAPGEGRNPVTIANRIHETGHFISSQPTFWLEDIQEISNNPLTTPQEESVFP